MNIYIKPVETCNLKCLHCYNGKPKTEKLQINEKLKKYIAAAVSQKDTENWIIFHGGEPLLADEKQLKEMTRLTFSSTKKRVTTNLTASLTPARMNFLLAMDDIRTSFDISIRFGHITNLVRWYHNVKALTEKKANVMVNICATSTLLKKDPRKLLHMLSKLGVKRFYVDILTDTGNAHLNKNIFARYDEVDNWLVRLHEEGKDFPDLLNMRDFEITAGIRNEHEFCRGEHCCHNTLTINSDGTVAGCVENSREKAFSNIDGNAVDDVQHIAAGKCNLLHKSICLSCEYFKACRGGCKNITWQNNACPYPKKLSDTLRGELQSTTPTCRFAPEAGACNSEKHR